MILENAVINILDKDSGNVICSQKELDNHEPLLTDYLGKIAHKITLSDCKTGNLAMDNKLMVQLSNTEKTFVEKAELLSEELFQIIASSEEVPAGDLAFFIFTNEQDERFFCLAKLNYADRYTHFLDYEEDKVVNKLILNKSILPSPSQRVDEAILVNLADNSYWLLEKKYMIEGEKINYFSEKFLEIETKTTLAENISTIKKAVKKVSKKFNEDSYVALADTQKAVYESIDMDSAIDTEKIAETVFARNPTAKQEYREMIKEAAVAENIEVRNVPKYEKKYSKQKFKLDNGIELSIPIDVYKDKEMVEFINNPDGTVSVVIKNVEKIVNKFN